MPVPPNTSLPKTTPNAVPSATCQSGMAGGTMSGISAPVTRKPSFTSCFRAMAKATSTTPPAAFTTATMGTKYSAP